MWEDSSEEDVGDGQVWRWEGEEEEAGGGVIMIVIVCSLDQDSTGMRAACRFAFFYMFHVFLIAIHPLPARSTCIIS
jgi:hypothetical protein